MRVLLSTIGSRGDVQPLLALALPLRALGHDVRLCVPPDFRAWIEGLGFAVTPIGPEVREMTAVGPSLSPDRLRALAEATVATQFETVGAAAQGCDVIVAAAALQIAARSLAEAMGIPYVFTAYCPAEVPSLSHSPTGDPGVWARGAANFNERFGATLNAHRAALGLAAVDDVRGHVFGERPWLAADPTLAPWPRADGRSVFQPGAWIVPDERPLPGELEAFLDAGEAPVYFGFGSVHAPDDLNEVMIGTARALGRRAIVSSGWADLSLVDDEPDCFAIGEEVNQQAVFARVAAIVHHGGAGTTTAAARAGAPQVAIPQDYDQHYWAQRIQQLGIGAAHEPGAPSAASLTSALEQALRPEVRTRAGYVAPAVRADGARLAAERLPSVVARERRTVAA